MHKPFRVLGIDPGTRITGYGIIETNGVKHHVVDYGCIRPSPKKTLHERYGDLFEGMEALIEQHRPDVVAVETQFVAKNPQSALKLGMARGVLLLAATRTGIKIFEYAPKTAKLAIGSGLAKKEDVQRMIKLLLNLAEVPTPEDAADALAVALAHIHRTNRCLPLSKEPLKKKPTNAPS